MNIKAFALGFALVLPLTVVGAAEAAPRPVTGTLTLHNFPTVRVPSPDATHGTADWVLSRDSSKGNVYVAAICYQGPYTEPGPGGIMPATVDVVTSSTVDLNGGTSGSAELPLWGWYDTDGYAHGMWTRWDDQPGDAWCYVEIGDWGNGGYRTYTVPTIITRSAQWLVDDPRA